MLRALSFALIVASATFAAPLVAQQADARRAQVLVIEVDRLLSESRLGRQIETELEAARRNLVQENAQIEAELTAEEQDLTSRRASLPPDEFRALAEAFDTKVSALRSAQDNKARALTQEAERQRQAFLQTVQPVLQALLAEAGAQILVERGTVLMVEESVLVTDLAIQRIDAELAPRSP
ncbi:OmpH family outer membrane protein [Pseudaestuariivita sp.]|uniref:OmpH family outer membrane protein n=1 Tax=Pseudaestuariivita sp. TaxID=2211669 RepID=UPI004058EAB0